jgi:hypothetical protein
LSAIAAEMLVPNRKEHDDVKGILIADLIGKNVFVRTVTHHYTGRLVRADERYLELEDAAWIADDGRFAAALKTGVLNEVEPYPAGCLVGVGALLDVSEWLHDLPREQK